MRQILRHTPAEAVANIDETPAGHGARVGCVFPKGHTRMNNTLMSECLCLTDLRSSAAAAPRRRRRPCARRSSPPCRQRRPTRCCCCVCATPGLVPSGPRGARAPPLALIAPPSCRGAETRARRGEARVCGSRGAAATTRPAADAAVGLAAALHCQHCSHRYLALCAVAHGACPPWGGHAPRRIQFISNLLR